MGHFGRPVARSADAAFVEEGLRGIREDPGGGSDIALRQVEAIAYCNKGACLKFLYQPESVVCQVHLVQYVAKGWIQRGYVCLEGLDWRLWDGRGSMSEIANAVSSRKGLGADKVVGWKGGRLIQTEKTVVCQSALVTRE